MCRFANLQMGKSVDVKTFAEGRTKWHYCVMVFQSFTLNDKACKKN